MFHNHEVIPANNHMNAFLYLNGMPYLLGEYMDKTQFRQIDRSMIKKEISVSQNEAMRAIVNIDIDDIGKRSDGLPNIVGNKTMNHNLIRATQNMSDRLNHKFDMIRRGIVVRINYQIENQRSSQVIRSTSEDLRIKTRNYFIDINPRHIDDNAIIINFMDTVVSTINQFTHGIDRMLIRITSIEMFYECLNRDHIHTNPKGSDMWKPDMNYTPSDFDRGYDPYYIHQHHQNRHSIGIDGKCNCDDSNNFYPPSWSMFNRFYHFDHDASDIILHNEEIYDRNNRVFLLPCGKIRVNKSFMINPGHRIIFKLSIWKNDLVVVTNTQRIANAIGAQTVDTMWDVYPSINNDLEKIIHLLKERNEITNNKLDKMWNIIQNLIDDKYPEGTGDIDWGDDGCDHDCGCNEIPDDEILNIIDTID